MKELCNIVHNNYERITDRVFWLSPDYTLKFNVDLFIRRTVNGSTEKEKVNYHREVGYEYDNHYGVKVSRDFNYYFSIEQTKSSGNKVVIGPRYMYGFKYNLDLVIDMWFKSGNVFNKTGEKIFIPTKPNPVKIEIDYGNYIELSAAVYEINGAHHMGIQWFLNSDTNSFFTSIDTMLALQYLLSNFNMFIAAQNMVNYIGRPENGTNYIDMTERSSAPSGFFNRVEQKKNR